VISVKEGPRDVGGDNLVIHQLVNVSAGAYNTLTKRWEN
jgi:hypothetical protein